MADSQCVGSPAIRGECVTGQTGQESFEDKFSRSIESITSGKSEGNGGGITN